MSINVLLDVNIVLDLLLKRGPYYYKKAELFAFLRQKEYPLFFAACALPSLEYIHTKEIKRLVDEGLIKSNLLPRELARQQLTRFLEAIKIAPSLGSHWRRIPEDHPDREDGLISLSSAELPGPTFIWTNDEDFYPAVSEIAFGDGLALQQYLENKAQRNPSFVDLGHQQSLIREHLEEGIDAAQSFGAGYKGKRACSLAEIACTSFFPAKPLGCYGDGGMCFTDDDQLAKIMESIRVHGKGSDKYDNIRIGINGRLDTLQAAILLAKFSIFPEEITLSVC